MTRLLVQLRPEKIVHAKHNPWTRTASAEVRHLILIGVEFITKGMFIRVYPSLPCSFPFRLRMANKDSSFVYPQTMDHRCKLHNLSCHDIERDDEIEVRFVVK